MINHFIDPSVNSRIEKDGFAVVPFADIQQIEELKSFYHSLPIIECNGTYVTMFHPSYEYRKAVDDKIRELFSAKAENFLIKYRVLFTNFMVKESGLEGDFPIHQDWTYVDETRYSSYAFWIPLQDVDNSNGALQVVRGSHKFITALRGPYVQEPFKNLSDEIKSKYAEPVNLKAGEALVWDHRLIHFSLPNITSLPRIAFTLIVVPKEAEVIHCFGLQEFEGAIVEKYLVGKDFYLKYTIGKKPETAPFKERIQQMSPTFNEKEFEQMINQVH